MRRLAINEVWDAVNKKAEYNRDKRLRSANHALLLELFDSESLNEGETDERTLVIHKIEANDFLNDPKLFRDSLLQSRYREMLTDYTIGELSKMKLFKLNGFNIGYALKPMENGGYDIVVVHNNEPEVRGIGEVLINSAIKNGGCFLDHYDTATLSNLYSKMGFTEIHRNAYNPDYDTNGVVAKKHGPQDVIYRIHKNCQDKYGQ